MAVCGHYTEPRVAGQGKSSVMPLRGQAQTRIGAECTRLRLAKRDGSVTMSDQR